jgi:hypothetical protein
LPCRLDYDRFVRAWIDFNERIALLHQVAFLEKDLHQLPVNPALDRYGVDRSNGSEASYVDTDISLHCLHCNYWSGGGRASFPAFSGLSFGRSGRFVSAEKEEGE